MFVKERIVRWARLIALFFLACLFLFSPVLAQEDEVTLTVLGRVVNTQQLAVPDAQVRLFVGGRPLTILTSDGEEADVVEAFIDGSYILEVRLPRSTAEAIRQERIQAAVEASSFTYRTVRQGLMAQEIACAGDHCYVEARPIVLPRVFNAAFFITVGVFLLVFVLISLRVMHETIAAMAGAVTLLAITYIAGSSHAGFHIIDFQQAVSHIDFDVIFLVLALMIFVAIVARTGVFQWLAFAAYRLVRGRPWPLAVALILITAITSAFLNNVTVMLLMAPVTIEIALVLGVDPLAFLVPEVLASNIGGTATFIGDPPNTLIGSYARLGFTSFLWNLAPLVVALTVVFIVMTRFIYRKAYAQAPREPSAALIAHLDKTSRITDPVLLRRSTIVATLTIVLFFIGDVFHMPPAVAALIGAAVLLVWARPGIAEMLGEVDWTTLVFFMALFMVVGALQDVGVIQVVAEAIKGLAGDSLTVAVLLILWVPAIGSAIVANIPFAAAMLPVTAYLSHSIPGAGNNVLWWALALGTCLGGNATVIGAAANIVTAGISDRAGYPLTFKGFFKVAAPVTFAILLISMAYLLIRY
jgi:Na+/H+ antiporter NhaD/arsenite permease-like protein